MLHKAGSPVVIPSRPGVAVFDDRHGSYWNAELPQLGVRVPDTGTRITVEKEASGGARTTLQVSPSP
ncbi:hypothetical protein [Streptomyces sp. NBC_01351]|uniref:hypothetical protein n=1 Tax=Streptomyces sp. NBC_01351 TaxID=2903833 RepID=UPI003FCCB90D